jgi:mannitol-specific phosphotransferase system IIBC component
MELISLFAIVIALVGAGTGYALMLGGPPLAKKFLKYIQRTVTGWMRSVFKWAWKNYKREIIGFALGVIFTLFLLGRL